MWKGHWVSALFRGHKCAAVAPTLQKCDVSATLNSGSSLLQQSDLGSFPRSFQFKKWEICIFPTLFEEKVNEPRSFRFDVKNKSIFHRLFKTIVFYDKYLKHLILNTFRGAFSLKRCVSLKTHHKMNIYQNKHVELPTWKKWPWKTRGASVLTCLAMRVCNRSFPSLCSMALFP